VRGEAADSVAEYLRYHQIVGDADGGIPFTDTEFAVSQRFNPDLICLTLGLKTVPTLVPSLQPAIYSPPFLRSNTVR
jgi:hypothetical protein